MSKTYTVLTFKGICMNFLLELKNFILSHPVTSKQPHKIVQIHMRRPVQNERWKNCCEKMPIYSTYLHIFLENSKNHEIYCRFL